MIKIYYQDCLIVLTEKEFNQLLQRFNPENIEYYEGKYVIDIPCGFCRKHFKKECKGCPVGFGMFLGCGSLLDELKNHYISVRPSHIFWSEEDDFIARPALRRFYERLKNILERNKDN